MDDEDLERQRVRTRWQRAQWEREGLIPPLPDNDAPPAPRDESFKGAVWRTLRAASFLILHTVVAIVLIGCISLVHAALHAMGDPKMFGTIPLRWGFDTMDFMVLLTYVIAGVSDARHVFRH